MPAARPIPSGDGAVGPSTSGGASPVAAAEKHYYECNDRPDGSLAKLGAEIGKFNPFLKLIGDGQLADAPKTNSGLEMCLAYQTRGRCYKDCGRHSGHVHQNEGKIARLCELIKKGLAKKAAVAPVV